jgi:hypothetical protein
MNSAYASVGLEPDVFRPEVAKGQLASLAAGNGSSRDAGRGSADCQLRWFRLHCVCPLQVD